MKSRINAIFAVAIACVMLVVVYLTYRTLFTTHLYKDLADPYESLPDDLKGSLKGSSKGIVFSKLPDKISVGNVVNGSSYGKHKDCTRIISKNPLSGDNDCVHSCKTGLGIRSKRNHTRMEFSLETNLVSTEKAEHRKLSFAAIFQNGGWGNYSSEGTQRVSGPGSVMNKTIYVRGTLAVVLDRLKTVLQKKTLRMLDIPCGDFTWMRQFLASRDDIIYTGMDIVPEMIAPLKQEFSNHKNISFHVHDIAKDQLSEHYDLIFVRHLTQHLTDYDTYKTLTHISRNQTGYLLITTYPSWLNSDLMFGMKFRFRSQNLEMPPFSLVSPLCQDTDGTTDVTALWKLPLKQVKGCVKSPVDIYETDSYGRRVYTCL